MPAVAEAVRFATPDAVPPSPLRVTFGGVAAWSFGEMYALIVWPQGACPTRYVVVVPVLTMPSRCVLWPWLPPVIVTSSPLTAVTMATCWAQPLVYPKTTASPTCGVPDLVPYFTPYS